MTAWRRVGWASVGLLVASGTVAVSLGIAGAQSATPDAADRLSRMEAGIAAAQRAPLSLAPVETTAEHRVIGQPAGEALVPLDPQRIVTLEPSLTDVVAALGFGDRIVGTVEYGGAFHEHVAPYLGPEVVSVGTEEAPNLEAISLAGPDLILTWDWYPEPVAQLREIAPTVVLPYADYEAKAGETFSDEQYLTWLTREVGAVLGVDDRVEPVLETYRAAVAEGRARLEEALAGQTVALLDVRPESILLSGYGFDGISALLYGDLGVAPDPLSEALPVWEPISLERIPELSADHILTFADGAESEERLAELLGNPLWQAVPAVREGRVHIVPSGLYYRGDDGPLGAVLVIADIVAKLAPDGGTPEAES